MNSKVSRRAAVAALLLFAWGGPVLAQVDPMIPPAGERVGLTSPLRMVTVATGDMAATRRFYEGALGMTATAVHLSGTEGRALAKHWGLRLSKAPDVVIFSAPGAPGSGRVRAVAVDASLPAARPGRDSRYLGPLGLGFASSDLTDREKLVNGQGFVSTAGVKRMDFARADGTTYNVAEIHFHAPDDLLVLGVDRGDMRPVGPIDPGNKIGGVAYSSALVGDAKRAGEFLSEVVGLTRRRATQFEGGGPKGGMIGLDLGEPVAFEQWFSGGSSTGYLVVMQRLKGERVMPPASGFDARGIALWTFETSDLDGAVARYAAKGGKAAISTVEIPGIGHRRAAVLRSPDNLAVELVEAAGPK